MPTNPCSGPNCGCTPAPPSRRDFLKTTLLTLGAVPFIAGPFTAESFAQSASPVTFIPIDKKLSPQWLRSLYEKGATRVYTGDELKTIAMPVGGICAGQLYITGDGRLARFDLFNHTPDTGAHNNYETRSPDFPLAQGFTLTLTPNNRGAFTKPLDITAFPNVTFTGEYPLATVTYPASADFPVRTILEAFSPFIPLNAPDSALPATVLRFTLTNTSDHDLRATLTGFLENAIARYGQVAHEGRRVNSIVRSPALTLLNLSVEPGAAASTSPARAPIVFDDFEGKTYSPKWTFEGTAFGPAPAQGTIGHQQPVTGYQGHGLANTYLNSDDPTGRATSTEFTIDRPFINFLIGGGAYANKTCLNLVIDGKVQRSATGRNSEHLDWQSFNVRPYIGKTAHLEIIDAQTGPWGHVNVDQIEFSDTPPTGTPPLQNEPDAGTMTLAVLAPPDSVSAHRARLSNQQLAMDNGQLTTDVAALDEPLISALSQTTVLPPNSSTTLTFLLTWHFPNRDDRGQFYATRFNDSAEVAKYLADNLDRLAHDTKLWHDTYYDSTIPHWLLDRLHMPVSTLATNTYQWWQNGRVWCWEGVGCCHGTCTHVYNYAQAPAHLFPALERSSREHQDFSTGFHDSGLVGFRGGAEYAADGQCGTVLKAYREHLHSPDSSFLKRNYPHIKRAMEFLIAHDASPVAGKDWRALGTDPHPDGPPDGVIEDPQHNTYDIWFHGPNTFVGALYLAALRATEEMATLMQDDAFATQCRQLFQSGSKFADEKLFDGEYYIQLVDLQQHPDHQYAHGCLADQLFGQNWATMLHLGPLFKPQNIRSALRSIYKYNWTPDVGPYNKAHPPQRYFARPGEAGLITCTFPKSTYLKTGVFYREEVWTGIEYQVASHLLAEGMLDEAMTILRGLHDRYDPKKHNPWNEIECGDHYARALASWGCLTALSGYHHDGPAHTLSFDPKLTPDNFKSPFTTATAWGTYEQSNNATTLTVRYGSLPLKELRIPRARATPTLNDKPHPAAVTPGTPLTTYAFDNLTLHPGDRLTLS